MSHVLQAEFGVVLRDSEQADQTQVWTCANETVNRLHVRLGHPLNPQPAAKIPIRESASWSLRPKANVVGIPGPGTEIWTAQKVSTASLELQHEPFNCGIRRHPGSYSVLESSHRWTSRRTAFCASS